jgi:hypothetical protein
MIMKKKWRKYYLAQEHTDQAQGFECGKTSGRRQASPKLSLTHGTPRRSDSRRRIPPARHPCSQTPPSSSTPALGAWSRLVGALGLASSGRLHPTALSRWLVAHPLVRELEAGGSTTSGCHLAGAPIRPPPRRCRCASEVRQVALQSPHRTSI